MQLFKPYSMEENTHFRYIQQRQQAHLGTSCEEQAQERNNPPSRQSQQDDNEINSINYLQFYQQYKKIYTVSHHLQIEKQRLAQIYQELNTRVILLQERLKNNFEKELKKVQNSSDQNRAKRSRRTAEMIEKRFKCNVQFCQRLYGSEGSLQQHIKLKHPQLYNNSQGEQGKY